MNTINVPLPTSNKLSSNLSSELDLGGLISWRRFPHTASCFSAHATAVCCMTVLTATAATHSPHHSWDQHRAHSPPPATKVVVPELRVEIPQMVGGNSLHMSFSQHPFHYRAVVDRYLTLHSSAHMPLGC